MPLAVHSDEIGGFEQALTPAGVMQIDTPTIPVAVPATIGAGLTYDSGLIYGMGYTVIAVGLTMDQAGTLEIDRYIDRLGLVAQTTVSSTPIVGTVALNVNLTGASRLPFMTFRIQITNSGGVDANLTLFAILLNAV